MGDQVKIEKRPIDFFFFLVGKREMLQRAASNAYTWWCASHIRTKQSKWLEQNMQDMEEKVKYAQKLLEEDGDSFAKRAEMYYRRRPELLSFVEEYYRAYKALAERYNHISTELQNANNTIATVFPDQVHFNMDYEDDDNSPRAGTPGANKQSSMEHSKIPKAAFPEAPKLNIPKLPKIPKKDVKGLLTLSAKKKQAKASPLATPSTNPRMSKTDAQNEVDKLQKGILALQTEKEFVMGSYERALGKYWDIEKRIEDMQQEACSLQDEFNVQTVIEDEEAQSLMASTALKSCQETLDQLQEKQKKAAEEAEVEHQRVKDAVEKFEKLKRELLPGEEVQQQPSAVVAESAEVGASKQDKPSAVSTESSLKILDAEVGASKQDIESIREKIKAHFDTDNDTCLTVTEMAEKIDELVTKVISLETAVSSQTALIKRLRSETDELHTNLQTVENDKSSLIKDSNALGDQLKKLEAELHGVEDLNKNFEAQNSYLHTHFTQAHCNLDHLVEKLQTVRYVDDEAETAEEVDEPLNAGRHTSDSSGNVKDGIRKIEAAISSIASVNNQDSAVKPSKSPGDLSEKCQEATEQGAAQTHDPSSQIENGAAQTHDPSLQTENGAAQPHDPSLQTENGVAQTHDPSSQTENAAAQTHDPSTQTDNAAAQTHDPSSQTENAAAQTHDSSTQTENAAAQTHDPSSQTENGAHSIHGISTQTENGALNVEPEEQEKDGDPIDWQKLYLHGLEDREKILLTEYTGILRNFKEAKRKLSEVEKKNRDSIFETMVQIKELKNANAMKDEEIQSLRQKITSTDEHIETHVAESENLKREIPLDGKEEGSASQCSNSDNQQVVSKPADGNAEATTRTEGSPVSRAASETQLDEDEEIKMILVDRPRAFSTIEEKFRKDIDQLLEENLDFWLRFSTSFHQIQKFQTATTDLKTEISKLKAKKQESKQEAADRKHEVGSSHSDRSSSKSDARPIFKHLREVQTELTVWLEKSVLLKDELQHRFSSLCDIQEEISRVLKLSRVEDVEITGYQAAKFQGEVLNMKQENNKVADELQTGLDHVNSLLLEIEKTLTKLNDEYKLGSKHHILSGKHSQSTNKPRIPLRSFLFNNKPAKKKPSIFLCINPILHKQHNSDLQGGFPT